MSSNVDDSLPGEPDAFRQMLETLPLSVYVDRPGDPASFSYVSPQIEAMFGYSLEQWREDSFFARILHPDDQERVLAERKAVLADGSRRASFDYRIVSAGGSPLWVRDEVVVVADQQSESVHLEGFLIDVTESVRRRRELEAVSLIAASASNVRDMREFYEEMHRVVGELTRADNCYVALYDGELDRVNYPYYVDLVDADIPDPGAWEPAGRGLTAYVLRTGRPLRADREVRGDLKARGAIEDVGADAVDWLGVPLRVEDRVLGVLAIQSYDERVRYDDEDQAVLTAIAANIASAIRHADLQREQRESERRYRQLVEAIPVAMYRSPEGEQNSSEYMSERAVAMFGYPIESWSDPDFYGTRPPPRRPRLGPRGERSAVDRGRERVGERVPHGHRRRSDDLDSRRVVDGARRGREGAVRPGLHDRRHRAGRRLRSRSVGRSSTSRRSSSSARSRSSSPTGTSGSQAGIRPRPSCSATCPTRRWVGRSPSCCSPMRELADEGAAVSREALASGRRSGSPSARARTDRSWTSRC